MAYGRLGSGVTAAATNLQVYMVPDNCLYAEINISAVNPSGTDTAVEISVGTNASPQADDYVEKGAIIAAGGGVLEHSGVNASPGERVIVKTVEAGVIVRVHGKELTKA